MNYVEYDPNTGVITGMGWSKQETVQAEIDAGKPIIATDVLLEWGKWQVNLETMQLEPIPEPPPPESP